MSEPSLTPVDKPLDLRAQIDHLLDRLEETIRREPRFMKPIATEWREAGDREQCTFAATILDERGALLGGIQQVSEVLFRWWHAQKNDLPKTGEMCAEAKAREAVVNGLRQWCTVQASVAWNLPQSTRTRSPQTVAPDYCGMVVDWMTDKHGDVGDEILCGNPAIMPGYCLTHALETAEDGIDTFTKEDGKMWQRLVAALTRRGVPLTAKERVLLAFDGKTWFLRNVALVRHDATRDEMIYYCDKPIGHGYTEVTKAFQALLAHVKESSPISTPITPR